jgi:hypothetical protein
MLEKTHMAKIKKQDFTQDTIRRLISVVLIFVFAVCTTACKSDASADGNTVFESPEPEEEQMEDESLLELSDTVVEERTDAEQTEQLQMTDKPASDASDAVSEEDAQFNKNLFVIVDGETIWLSITEEELFELADYLREELGLNDAAIAGVLANLQEESGFDPNKIGDMGAAYGICQWRGARLDQMVQYCDEQDLNPIKLEGQLAFLVHDLKENYIYPYDLLLASPDTEQGALQATYDFCAYYEVPSDPSQESEERERLTKLLIYPTLNDADKETAG